MKFKKRKLGLIIENICKCGKYKPISLKGLINTDCKNCGGKKAEMIFM